MIRVREGKGRHKARHRMSPALMETATKVKYRNVESSMREDM